MRTKFGKELNYMFWYKKHHRKKNFNRGVRIMWAERKKKRRNYELEHTNGSSKTLEDYGRMEKLSGRGEKRRIIPLFLSHRRSHRRLKERQTDRKSQEETWWKITEDQFLWRRMRGHQR